MKKNREKMIAKLTCRYPDVSFSFIEKKDSIQLLYSKEELEFDSEFMDYIYDIAIEEFAVEELNIFSVVYDYLDEIPVISFISSLNYKKNTYYSTSNRLNGVVNEYGFEGVEEAIAA